MAQGDDTTREETQVRTDQGSGGDRRGIRSRPSVPDHQTATDVADARAARTAPDPASAATQGSPSPAVDGDPSTDELDTVAEAATPARPSVLPPDVAAARTAMHRRTTEIPIVAPRYGEDDDADPLVDDADGAVGGDPTETAAAPAAHRPHVVLERRAGLWFSIALLTVLLIGATTLAAYLWHVADEWEAQVAELTDVSYGLGDDLAAERESLVAAQDRIELLTDQLSTSKDTVTRLQAENARWGDDAAFAQEQIGQLRDLIAAGTAATGSLSRCIDAHDQLISYLEAPDDYEPDEIAAFQESMSELCTEASSAAQEFTTAAAL